MKRRSFIETAGGTALMALLYNRCAAPGKLPNSTALVDTPEKRAAYLDNMLNELCADIGTKPAGSPNYQKAALIVKREMEKAFPIVELDTFTLERWVLKGEPEFRIGGIPVETYPAHGSLGTPPEGITGMLRAIEDDGGVPYGLFDDSDTLRAYITVYENLAVPLPYYFYKKSFKCLPTFNIGSKDEHIIRDAVEQKTPVTVRAEVEFIPDTRTCNVVGTLPGETTEEAIFIAHLDTVYNTVGANDNTASLIMMLILAHAVSGIVPKKTLTFLATEGEEYNKLGAINYAERRKGEGTFDAIKWLFNFDSITWGPNIKIYSQDEELRTIFTTIDEELNIPGTPELIEGDGFMLDGQPFRETGARAIYFNSTGSDHVSVWHRPSDTPETVPPEAAEICFLLCREFIRRFMDM